MQGAAVVAIGIAVGGPAIGGAWAGLLALMRHGHDWIDALTIEVVTLIGAIGGAQSYVAMRELALNGGLPEWQADTWPAVIDMFAVVMGLAALRGSGAGRRDVYATALALIYSLAAVFGNLAIGWEQVQHDHLSGFAAIFTMVAHGAPVATMLLGAHWLMRRSAALAAGARATVRNRQAKPSGEEVAPPLPERGSPQTNGERNHRTPAVRRDSAARMEEAVTVVRRAMADGTPIEEVTGTWLGRELGVSAQRGREWLKRVKEALAVESETAATNTVS